MTKVLSILTIIGVFAAMLFVTPSSAFAGSRRGGSRFVVKQDNDSVRVSVHNHAHVFNVTAAICVSGVVEQEKNDDSNAVTTGNVECKAKTENVVNSTYINVAPLE